jgi:hypothetical protein
MIHGILFKGLIGNDGDRIHLEMAGSCADVVPIVFLHSISFGLS